MGLLTGGWWDVSGGCRRRVPGAVGGIRQAMLHLIIKPGLGKTDQQFMKRAEELLYEELSLALDMPKDQVKDHILQTLEPAAQ